MYFPSDWLLVKVLEVEQHYIFNETLITSFFPLLIERVYLFVIFIDTKQK